MVLAAGTLPITAQQPPTSRTAEYHLDGDKLQKAQALHKIRVTRYLVGTAYSILVLFALIRFRIALRFQYWAKAASRLRFVQAFLFSSLLLLTVGVLALPLDVHGYRTALKYGLSVQTWTSWVMDWLKAQLLTVVIGTLVSFVLFAIIRRSPRRWWLLAWLAAIPFVIFVVFISPVVIDPMFEHFEPLAQQQPGLVSELQKVVHRGGLDIPQSRMYEMRASEKVTTYNAYVTGIGPSKRVVVWDTTAHELSTPETLFIFGHEMGHYVLHHIWKGLAFSIVGLFFGFWITYKCFNAILAKWVARYGIESPHDWASAAVLLLIASVLIFIGQPMGNWYSRYLEHQADIYGLEVVHGIIPDSSEAAASSFQQLGEKSLVIPTAHPLLVFWTYSHPPIADRFRFALQYRPWDRGEEPKFVK